MNNSVKIYVAYHKKSRLFKNDFLEPIFAGKDVASDDFEIIGDNTGENISFKNPTFAELTALYWVWKNAKEDYTGVFHYRRFLNVKNDKKFFEENDEDFLDEIWDGNKLCSLLEKYDLILPKIYNLPENMTIYEQYDFAHNVKDLDLALEILADKYPFLKDRAELIVQGSHKMYTCNLFIAKKEIYDEIMSFVFSILFELEKSLSLNSYNDSDKRVFGFLSERLLTIYFMYLIEEKRIPFLELPVAMLYPKEEWLKKINKSV